MITTKKNEKATAKRDTETTDQGKTSVSNKSICTKPLNSLKKLQEELDARFPGIILMPSREGGKIPKYAHKGGQYTSEIFKTKGYKECTEGCLMILTEDIIVIDIDDHDLCNHMEGEIEVLTKTVCCETAKGRHYYFLSTEYSKKHGMKDGARQMKKENGEAYEIDIKTKGGVISIPPSPNKSWLRPILETEMLPIPDRFVEFYVKTIGRSTGAVKVATQSPSLVLETEEVIQLMGMLNSNRADNYTEWLQLGWCLHNIGKGTQDYCKLWDDFSKISSKYNEGECCRLWGEMRNDGLNIGSLHMWAKTDNPDKYKEYQVNNVYSDIKDCNGSHKSIAKIAHKLYCKTFVCVNSTGSLWYYFDGNLWIEDEGGIVLRKEIADNLWRKYVDVMVRYRNEAANKEGDQYSSASSMNKASKELCDKLQRISFKLEDSKFKESLVKEMRLYFYDKNFFNKLDTNPNLIGFNNGVWNLKEGHFRKAQPEDMISLTVGYDYTPKEDPTIGNYIATYFKQMHPNEEQRTYVLKTLARQLYGDSGGELFHIHAGHNGSAGNGKSAFFKLLENALGKYVGKFQVGVLVIKQRQDPNRPMPSLEEWKGTRILYCSEPNKEEKLHSGIMKELTGGEKMSYRMCNGNTMKKFEPMFKLHIMCNDPPEVDGRDQGVKRRIRKIDYMSLFVDANEVDPTNHKYQKDLGFIEKFRDNQQYRMEFLRYILSHYDHNFKYEMPEIIKLNSASYLDDNNKILQFVNEFIEEDPESFFTLKQAKEKYKESDYYEPKVNLKTALEKLLKTWCLDEKKIRNTRYRSVFMGYNLTASADFLV